MTHEAMKLIQSFRIPYQKDPDLISLVATHLGCELNEIKNIRILKRSLDARNRQQFFWEYSLQVYFEGDKIEAAFESFPKIKWVGDPPIIVGSGPAGLFAALTFLQHGIKPILVERGERTHERMRKISKFWRTGELDEDCNVCHGEGGAGTFSDGKLVTRIKSPHIGRVMQTFVDYGAPTEITYAYNPHVGSNLMRNVIRRMSDDLMAQGADIRFGSRVDGLDLSGNHAQGVRLANGDVIRGSGVILACGHSAGPFLRGLHAQGVHVEPKSFALGLRIEHAQEYINQWQYGTKISPEELGPAQYKLQTFFEKEKIGVYTFCMCPGGYVISSSPNRGQTVVNGMSNLQRRSLWANAAVVCSVDHNQIEGVDPFKLLNFQTEIEKNIFSASAERGGAKKIPAQRLEDFLLGRKGEIKTRSSCPSGIVPADLSKLLPNWIYKHLAAGLLEFDKNRKGFANRDALLHAVESRTSSPVRITRDPETFESMSVQGLFPCGEGAGYAGGITSSAVDGINAALKWVKKFSSRA